MHKQDSPALQTYRTSLVYVQAPALGRDKEKSLNKKGQDKKYEKIST